MRRGDIEIGFKEIVIATIAVIIVIIVVMLFLSIISPAVDIGSVYGKRAVN